MACYGLTHLSHGRYYILYSLTEIGLAVDEQTAVFQIQISNCSIKGLPVTNDDATLLGTGDGSID